MTPERWAEIQQQLEVALSLPPAERQAFLESIGAHDTDLRGEIESLLAADLADPTFLNSPALSPHRLTSTEFARDSMTGCVFGAYQMGDLIGVGGMGEVYRAVRADGHYQQQVAVKIVRPGSGSGISAVRFRNERQILANLDHPNIAKILDGGTTPDGLPYFVMEFIDGLPITEYCDRNRLSIEDRLRLFRTVCSAVHYAHQRLVIHRDIKPTNILVTSDGTPKLLDFGIAKIMSPDLPTEDATVTGIWTMTPEYASPEQFQGEPITTATDVYSLGLVLFELMTGRRAYRFSGRMPHEIARTVLESEPDRPSRAILRRTASGKTDDGPVPPLVHELRNLSSPQKLHRRLSGDPDNIVLKALRKDPAERYASADQLSEDIRRHLEGLPVSARKGTLSYRVSKYVLRHKVGVASVALVFLTLVAGIVVTLREARIARRNELRAERRFNDVRKLAKSLLFEIHDSVRDLPGSTPARKLIVENALQYLDSLSSDAAGDSSLERELATAYERVGEAQGHYLLNNLGETSNALHSYQKALRLRQDLSSSTGSAWPDMLALARCYRLVSVQMQATGNVLDAAEKIQSATALMESVRKEHPQEISVLDELSLDYERNGQIHHRGSFPSLDDVHACSESYRKAIAVDEDWVKIAPSSEEAQHALAWSQMEYAGTLGPDERYKKLHYYERSLEIAKRIATQTTSIQRARDVAVVYNHFGMFYSGEGDIADSLKSYQSGLQIYEDLIAKDPQNKLLSQGLAIAHANVSEQLGKLGRVRESKAEIAKAINLMENLVRANPNNASQQSILAEVHKTRAQILRHSNDPGASLADYKVVLAVYRDLLEKDSSNMSAQVGSATASLGMAKAEWQLHHSELASTNFRTALAAVKPLLLANNPDQWALYTAADAYAGLGRLENEEAGKASPSERKLHLENATNWFGLSLEQLTRIQQPVTAFEDDVGPIDSARIRKELAQCEAELRQSGH